jgi:DNA-binding CsgD family transcriptional regulator
MLILLNAQPQIGCSDLARILAVSPRTVETHRANLFAKLEAQSLAQLIRGYAALVDEAAAP